jgi:hypothetical protein
LFAEHVTLLAAAVRKLEDGLELIAKEQEYIKIREHAHRDCKFRAYAFAACYSCGA